MIFVLSVLLGLSAASASLIRRAVTLPPVNGQFSYQIGGAYTPESGVTIVDRDNSDNPVAGLYNICYINAFQTQVDETWPSDLILKHADGSPFEDPDWEGEYFLDTSTASKRAAIAAILEGTIDTCASKGFNAIEPDNLDTFTRSENLLTAADNLALAKTLADYAHSKGLAFAQKNAGPDLGSTGKSTAGFDFAIAEECQVYTECPSYTNVYGNNVIEIEYSDNGKSYYTAACKARGATISIIYRDRDVEPSGKKAYTYAAC